MTRDQFLQLAGQLYDAQSGGGGSGSAKAPKYDTSLPAGSGQVIYASECSLKELQYQLGRAQKPPKDPKWQEANDKRAKALGYWISYRQSSPLECWTGERNRRTVTAPAPLDKPKTHDREATSREPEPQEPPAQPGADDMDDIPF